MVVNLCISLSLFFGKCINKDHLQSFGTLELCFENDHFQNITLSHVIKRLSYATSHQIFMNLMFIMSLLTLTNFINITLIKKKP
jgi:hypothetical protein